MICSQETLFVAGRGGYHTYRIPALAVTTTGTLLAFCEGRRNGPGDAGFIDLLLVRSPDGGRTWQEPRRLVSDPPHACSNPAPVVDRRSGAIWLAYCHNASDATEARIAAGLASRTVWICHSADDGVTWSPGREITADVREPGWTWYATGPGHGIQLRDGRMVIACDHVRGVHLDRARDPGGSHLIESADGGRHWRLAGIAGPGTNEACAVEDGAGRIGLNCRSATGQHARLWAWSDDGGASFAPPVADAALVDPVCQASVLRHSPTATGGADRILFSNAASGRRENLTVRLSEDGCRTWPVARTLHAGPSAYSDLAVTPDGLVCCLYEGGRQGPYETLTLARFDLPWLAAAPA